MSERPALEKYEYQKFTLPRTTGREAAREVLTIHALYGEWELARVRLYPDGTRHITMRRPRRRASAAQQRG